MNIAISGKRRSGKDTITKIFLALMYNKNHSPVMDVEQYAMGDKSGKEIAEKVNAEICRFSDPRRSIICNLIGCECADLEDKEYRDQILPVKFWKGKEPMTVNDLMVWVSEDIGRKGLYEDIWADANEKKVKIAVSKRTCVFTPDMKYINELNAMKSIPGNVLIRVNRWRTLWDWIHYFGLDQTEEVLKWYAKENGNKELLPYHLFENKITSAIPPVHLQPILSQNKGETELDNKDYLFDFVLENKGDISYLIQQVKEIARTINLI